MPVNAAAAVRPRNVRRVVTICGDLRGGGRGLSKTSFEITNLSLTAHRVWSECVDAGRLDGPGPQLLGEFGVLRDTRRGRRPRSAAVAEKARADERTRPQLGQRRGVQAGPGAGSGRLRDESRGSSEDTSL